MIRNRLALLALVPFLTVATAAMAEGGLVDPVKTDTIRANPAPAGSRPAAAPAQPGHHAPPAASTRRAPRSYQQCRVTAIQRHLRGAERRHYITRCQLGYGRPLFRPRRHPATLPPGQPGAPAVLPPGQPGAPALPAPAQPGAPAGRP